MELKGKLFCGIAGIFIFDLLGIPFGGLLGFIFGSMAGHYLFDQPREVNRDQGEYKAYQKRQGEFFFHAFRLLAKLSKADGPINNREVQHMEFLMAQTFKMNQQGRTQGIKIWNQAKSSNDTFDHYIRAFFQDFGRERHLVLNMMDLLFSMAACDGRLHPREEELLLRAAGIFHIGRMQYERIKSRYFQSRTNQTGSTAANRWSPLDPHYAILGAQPAEPLDDIKKKYRALAMQWHPDKMAAKGATPEALRHAKEKFQQINEAWERIKEAKKS